MYLPIFTYSVIAVTVIASLIGFANKSIFEKSVFSVGAIIKKKEIHRLITSLFFHVNLIHLFFNMFSYYSFGASIEKYFGIKLAIILYIYSALGGDGLALLIRRKNLNYTAVGASGAVCGVIFASIFLLPGGSIIVFPLPIPVPSWVYAVLFMAISLYGIGKSSSSIGHEAHIGGALTGIIWAVLYKPSIIYSETLLLAGLTIPTILLLIYFIKFRKNET
jgi:membrane associated rhomboid family serine protease